MPPIDSIPAEIDSAAVEQIAALTVLLSVLTLIFVIVVAAMAPVASYLKAQINVANLIALTVALIPTTIGAPLSAIGIAAIRRWEQRPA